MQQMYSCPNCRAQVTFGTPSCPNCGQPFSWPAQPQQQPPPVYQQPYEQQYRQGGGQPEQKKKSPWLIGCLGLIVLGVLIGIIMAVVSGSGEQPSTGIDTNWSEQAVTESSVRDSIQDLSGTNVELGNITKIEVLSHLGTADPDDFIIHVHYKVDSVWDEEDAVEKAVHTAIKAMEVLFLNNKISSVCMWQEQDFTDKYGKTTTELAVRLCMEKEVANKIVDWETIDDRAWADYNTFFNLAELQYIHPAISKEL